MAHARFETFLLVPEELAERRRRLMMGALSAALLSMTLGLTSYTADKLGIRRVDPPKHTYAVTLQVLEPPPPPAAPPPRPAGATASTSERADPPDEPDEPEEPLVPSVDVEPLARDTRPARVAVPGFGGEGDGDVRGNLDGILRSRCPLPPCIGTQQVIGRPTVPRPTPPATAPTKAPIEAVMATSVFTPNPDQDRLARTVTGRSHRRPGKTTVAFCIDGNGKTYDVRVRRGFPGDAQPGEVDEICRSTVAKWRFSPQRVGGKARSTCTTVTFDIRFE